MTKARDLASNAEGTKPKVIDAAGDLIYGTGSDAASRLAIGTAGQVLTVNSGATAPEWAEPASTGITWTQRKAAGELGITSVRGATYTNSKWVIWGTDSSSNQKIAYSSDGINWTAVSPGGTTNALVVHWSPLASLWILGGSSGQLYTSPDLDTWTSRTSNMGASDINDITENGSIIVAVGESGAVATSTDGTTWTARTSNLSGNLTRIVWGAADGIFCIAGNSQTASNGATTSSDGITWTAQTVGTSIGHIFYVDGVFYGFSGTTSAAGRYSNDGATWTLLSNVPLISSATTYRHALIGTKLFTALEDTLYSTELGTIYNNTVDVQFLGTLPFATGTGRNANFATDGTNYLLATAVGSAVWTNF